MKRSILLSTMLCAALSAASTNAVETSILGGLVFPDSDTNLEDQKVVAGEIQYNGFDFFLKPELQVIQSLETDYTAVGNNVKLSDYGSTSLTRVALNGVYDIGDSAFKPFLKAGLGYEVIQDHEDVDARDDDNEDGAYAQVGAGVKYALTDAFALKAEALYMKKISGDDSDNIAVLAGLTYSFGTLAAAAPVAAVAAPVVAKVVEAPKKVAKPVEKVEKKVVADADADGVADSSDKCLKTPANTKVDASGCEILPAITYTFQSDSSVVSSAGKAQFIRYGKYISRNNSTAKVVGHTDNTNTAAYNQKLSDDRAQKVAQILIDSGVNSSKITTVGRGETEPIATNATEEGRAANRRVEVKIK